MVAGGGVPVVHQGQLDADRLVTRFKPRLKGIQNRTICAGPLDRIQDLGLHLISLNEAGGTEAVPHLPLRASLAHPGLPP